MAPLRFETKASAFLATLSICFRALMTRRASFLPEPVVRAARRAFCALVSFLRISVDSFESIVSPGQRGPAMARARQSIAVTHAGSVLDVVVGLVEMVVVVLPPDGSVVVVLSPPVGVVLVVVLAPDGSVVVLWPGRD